MLRHFLLLCTLVALVAAQGSDRRYQLHSILAYDPVAQDLFQGTLSESLRDTHTVTGTMEFLSQTERDAPTWFSNSPIPSVNNRAVVDLFGQMSSDAYYTFGSTNWVSVGTWSDPNNTRTFGWDSTTLRGYVFHEPEYNETVIAFKGTDTPFFGETSHSDTAQDWFMFSCCGEGAPTVLLGAYTGCGCDSRNPNTGHLECDLSCFHNCVVTERPNSYFVMALRIFQLAQNLFPGDFFFTGHSLGGSVAQLLSTYLYYPSVTFEAPPTRRHAWVQGMNVSDSFNFRLPIFGFGAYNDPIFVGDGNCGPCNAYGAPIKTKCHLGYTCVWDIPRDTSFGYGPQTRSAHSIDNVLFHIQTMDIPPCQSERDCWDCESYTIID